MSSAHRISGLPNFCLICIYFFTRVNEIERKKIFEEEIMKLFRPVAKAIKLFFAVVIVPLVVAFKHFQPSLMFPGEARSL